MRTATHLAALTLGAALLAGCAAPSGADQRELSVSSGARQPSMKSELRRAEHKQVVRLVTMCLDSYRDAREVYDSHWLHQRCLRWAQTAVTSR